MFLIHGVCVSAIARLCVHAGGVCACAPERVLYARVHVGGDKRVFDVSRGEGLWNMESGRVVPCVTPGL